MSAGSIASVLMAPSEVKSAMRAINSTKGKVLGINFILNSAFGFGIDCIKNKLKFLRFVWVEIGAKLNLIYLKNSGSNLESKFKSVRANLAKFNALMSSGLKI